MVKGPAAVFIARHGARLDASDKSWHLTSPTPYDPPLTYGGWSQAKALGLRIAALLHQQDVEETEAAKHGANADLAHLEFSALDAPRAQPARPRNKKRKIVIHSSPFLRCVQTSTAVAAGISQYKPEATPRLGVPAPSKERSGVLGSSPLARSARSQSPRTRSPSVQPAYLDPLVDPNLEVYAKPRKGEEKILLRIDAFLGEWLSPDYYEDITPPPNSTLMVAGAKADLLRRGDNLQAQPDAHSSKGHFPGGWGGASKGAAASAILARCSVDNGAFATMNSLTQNLPPTRERAGSLSGGGGAVQSSRPRGNFLSLNPSTRHVTKKNYNSPAPSYSVSPSDPIPRGYVAHAREACVTVDFQWDSMRPPQNWGDGGEYGDEWSTMHKRFRRGLTGMMEWYREHGATPPKDPFPGFTFSDRPSQPDKEPRPSAPKATNFAANPLPLLNGKAEDEEEELVLVLVTHGAGCNALLGAIQNQPVLIDVGLASLSMAVRRDQLRKPSAPTVFERRLSVADPGMSDSYEMKILASVDHLRPSTNPAVISAPESATQSPAVHASPTTGNYRKRFTGSSSGAGTPSDSPLDASYRSWLGNSNGVRRTASSGSNSRHSHLNDSGISSPSSGLWSSPRMTALDASSDGRCSPGADMVLNFTNQQSAQKSEPSAAPVSQPAATSTAEAPVGLTKMTTNEQRECGDSVAPLPTSLNRTNSTNSSSAAAGGGGGLWGAKPQATTQQGLWGSPKLSGVTERESGLKRRWTITEHNQ
ncbi:uncharacterized protein M421DRAFT_419062 [Didymella exigua CBS 183.55]|uniref:Phosphoglycerate mutase family protein n=1 Tax=Didymella exigua CBS 183.55 TaxID=1150837 RepID=A0A6A5RNP3_9PLEO|nr:uncharacterized protein M421DRAFT_419062 [Didymella exigua CBS 183.55]KAF1930031.1 hypothetical protein M421DRAFT_419062 [Didymella exigua CBS 183.55]